MNLVRAEEFCRSYERAVAAVDHVAIAGHYGFPHTAFVLGQVVTFADRDVANAAVESQNTRLRTCGAGNDIRLAALSVQTVSDGSALCNLTWEITPADGTPGWRWLNIYGLRQTDEHQYFEFNVSDNEIAELLRRYPSFLDEH